MSMENIQPNTTTNIQYYVNISNTFLDSRSTYMSLEDIKYLKCKGEKKKSTKRVNVIPNSKFHSTSLMQGDIWVHVERDGWLTNWFVVQGADLAFIIIKSLRTST